MALPRITVLGSLNIDLVSYVPHHPAPGETLTASSFAISPGGKGANQAVACAKLSRRKPTAPTSPTSPTSPDDPSATAHVSMLGAVGADSYGALLRSNLASHGVDVSGVAVRGAGVNTGVALIIVDEPSGQNRIVLSPEANHTLSPEGFATPAALGTPAPDLLIMQLEVPLPVVLAAQATARAAGIPVLLNPAPAVPLPAETYAGLAHLVVNETEAALLSGVEEAELDTVEGVAEAARVFVQRGVENVVVTLGGRGVYYADHKGREGLVPAEKATVVDTTAAGDTFVGQYALEVVAARKKAGGEEFAIEGAVRKANRAAARTVERKGAQDSIPWRDELA